MRFNAFAIIMAIYGLLFASLGFAESSTSLSGLQTETMLHPLDGFTAYTLKKNEFVFNQSPMTFPIPSWAWWGVTDWLTAEIDLLPLIGGLFIEPHLPVPSFNFRFRLKEEGPGMSPAIAFETMVQYLYEKFDQIDSEHLLIQRKGLNWFNRINASFRLSDRWRLHLSGGVTYSHYLNIQNRKRSVSLGRLRRDEWNPDASLSIDFRFRPWISFHATGSYGTTFVYFDNIQAKQQFTYGFRLAPFLDAKAPIWRNLRAEFSAIFVHFDDADEFQRLELPILPYVYWQWQW